ncbi:Memo-like protein [uncultured archaeon]|nr:Memo-like protein [uncultured archaeon]
MWYPEHKEELELFIENAFKKKPKIKSKKINGLIVPHAGYEYSGKVAGKAFSLLKNKKVDKAIIIGPSHYVNLSGPITATNGEWKTSLGKIAIIQFPSLEVMDLQAEHSIKNQVPFLQKIGIKEIIPIMIGRIEDKEAKELAKKIAKINAVYIFSTDLSHFLTYEEAVQKDRSSIKIIKELNETNFKSIDACGYFPLRVLFHLCKIKKTHPHLIEYKNSGDITGDKSTVVGYASFWF